MLSGADVEAARGAAGVTVLARTALRFAAGPLGVATDEDTVAGVVALNAALVAIESTTYELTDIARDAQRARTSLGRSGRLSSELLLPQVLQTYGFTAHGRDYPIYLDDPYYLLKRLPDVDLRGGDTEVLRAYLAFAAVVRLYADGVLTQPAGGSPPQHRTAGAPAGPPRRR